MGWKSTARSLNASINRMEREAEKRQRQLQKATELRHASNTVEEQQYFFGEITSLHHRCRANMDWDEIAKEYSPAEPVDMQANTIKARTKLDRFKPFFIETYFKIEDWRRTFLERKLEKALILDAEIYANDMDKYQREKKAWEKRQDIAQRIKTDGKAMVEALAEYLDLNDLMMGADVELITLGYSQFQVNIRVKTLDDIVPDVEYSLRQSGTLSSKKMPRVKGLDLYQDYVCSALIRVAREVMGIIPLDMIRVNAILEAVNSTTGHLEDQTIVSAIIPRATLNKLNFSRMDPSDALSNFLHNMSFQKTKGFKPVDDVAFPEVRLNKVV